MESWLEGQEGGRTGEDADMQDRAWESDAWAAWERYDAPEAIDSALRAANDDALRLACYFAVRSQRADLLVEQADRIATLDRGVVRDAALTLVAVTTADLRRAKAIASGLRDSPPDVSTVAADDDDAAIGADTLSWVAMGAMAAGAWRDARECVTEARVFLDRIKTAPTTYHARSWLTRTQFDLLGVDALAEYHTRGGQEAQRALDDAIGPLRRENQVTVEHTLALICLGDLQHLRGDLAGAAVILARGLDLAAQDRPGLAEHARIELAFIRVREGRWDDADLLAGASQAPPRTMDTGWFTPQVAAVHALMTVLRGDPEVAQELIESATQRNLVVQSYLASMILLHARIVLAIVRRDWISMARIVEDATDPGYRHPYRDNEWRALLLAAAWFQERTGDIRERYAEWTQHPGAEDDPYFLMFTVLLANRDEISAAVDESARRALSLLGPEHDPAGRALVRAVIDEETSHEEPGSVADDGRPVSDADSTASTGPAPAQSRAEVAPPPSQTLPSLTPQQRRIAVAVAQGYTSAEIATMLHLTKRTIDYHVTNILRRLDITSRREIARHLHAARPRPPHAKRA